MLSKELQEKYPVKTRNQAKGRVPFCYKKREDDPNTFDPVPEIVLALEQALDYLEDGTMSLRQATAWLVETTGKQLSHQALNKFYNDSRSEDSPTLKERKLKKQLLKEQRLTREQRKQKNLAYKITQARKRRTFAENAVKRLEKPELVETPAVHQDKMEFDYDTIPQDREIIFQPNPGPQTEFLASPEKQVLYGGAAGGEPKSGFYRLLSQ